ncbi:MAG: hypothetical protein H6820_05895 [Phycisphaerales bacterium]|nr:hypothetical protein [Phycisphaerales bacterium]
MRGISASANRSAVHGPDRPSGPPSSERRLCQLLNLTAPTNRELLDAAAAEIESLRDRINNPRDDK